MPILPASLPSTILRWSTVAPASPSTATRFRRCCPSYGPRRQRPEDRTAVARGTVPPALRGTRSIRLKCQWRSMQHERPDVGKPARRRPGDEHVAPATDKARSATLADLDCGRRASRSGAAASSLSAIAVGDTSARIGDSLAAAAAQLPAALLYRGVDAVHCGGRRHCCGGRHEAARTEHGIAAGGPARFEKGISNGWQRTNGCFVMRPGNRPLS